VSEDVTRGAVPTAYRRKMPRAVLLCVLVFVVSACDVGERHSSGERARQAAPTVQNRRDMRSLGIYTYEQAKRLGIVRAVPPGAPLCHPTPDPGFTPAQLKSPKMPAARHRECWAEKLALYSVGYSIEAVRDAPTAYLKGQIICTPGPPIPPGGSRFTRGQGSGRRLGSSRLTTSTSWPGAALRQGAASSLSREATWALSGRDRQPDVDERIL
jgi:hypothetical protein